MSLFDDLSQFLENKLDEFLRANPHLELQALEEQLRGQEEDTVRLLAELKRREQQLQNSILETAQEVQRWHGRIQKAQAANRMDLVRPAQERQAALLRQGNHLWGQMKGVKGRIEQTQALVQRIQSKRQEVKVKIAQVEAQKAASQTTYQADPGWGATGWNQNLYDLFSQPLDPLEETFKRWETEEELDDLKRQMGE